MARKHKRRRNFGDPAATHRHRASDELRMMRHAARDVREFLKSGNCPAALRAFSRMSVAIGAVHGHRVSMGKAHHAKFATREVTGELRVRKSLHDKIIKQCMR